ncbi:MAG: DoxX family protein [Terracidiphilus sp.]
MKVLVLAANGRIRAVERPVSPWRRPFHPDHAARCVQSRPITERFNHLNRKKRITFNMKTEHTSEKPAWAGRATQIAAMALTGLVAIIWVYFGRLYLIHDPGEWRIANQLLGYPLYIIPLIGVTHILGGVGLLIPNVPRLTEWIYAGLSIDLLLAFYSQLNGGGSSWDKFDPILVMAFVFASYVLRRCVRENRWSI